MPDYLVTYRRLLDEQSFWDYWDERLHEVLSEAEYAQFGIDFRTVMRTHWLAWNQKRDEPE